MNDLSIIIVNWNTRKLLLDCIASVYRTVRKATLEVIVVDNASTDGSVEALSHAFAEVRLIANKKNAGFATANNQALKEMNGRYAVLLNSDTILKEGALEQMLGFMDRNPQAGICGPQLLYEDGSKQASFGTFPTLWEEFGIRTVVRILSPQRYKLNMGRKRRVIRAPSNVDYIVGACMMVRKSAIDTVGMLDESYFFCFEEIDWCMRMMKAGWHVYHLPDIEIYHLQSMSVSKIQLRSRAESWRSRYLFFKKNRNLSAFSSRALILTGFILNSYRFIGYTMLNVLTLFALKRLRRWTIIYGYLLIWHFRGRPMSMCLPR